MSMKRTLLALSMLVLVGCATHRPVLYPNARYQEVGQMQAERDVEECKRMAETAGANAGNSQAGQMAASGAKGAAVGAATGAVAGAIAGNAGQGAGIGAATGLTASLLNSLFREAPPNPAYRNFVDRCLRDRGYDITGWN
ncbi:MAG: hypothetical protein HY943_00665 [Gammaproteobacteria bacterium]|nr:hypothetical protein [Gammaproteobacteria bacterium]